MEIGIFERHVSSEQNSGPYFKDENTPWDSVREASYKYLYTYIPV